MKQRMKLLVLAGSAEAREIATSAQAAGCEVHALITEPPRGPNPLPVPCALHEFADVNSVMAAMTGFDAIVDASHGFDGRMSSLGLKAARVLDLPFLSYARPSWLILSTENMTEAVDVPAALSLMGPASRVFSATGWASLPEFAEFKGDRLFLRQTSQHTRPSPFDFVELVFGNAPFDVASETALFKYLSIDTLVCRNLGGTASRPKVDAALALGLKVILIARPALPETAQVVEDVAEALAWIKRQ